MIPAKQVDFIFDFRNWVKISKFVVCKVDSLTGRVVYRSNNNANANCGVANANANNDSSNANANNGSRLDN